MTLMDAFRTLLLLAPIIILILGKLPKVRTERQPRDTRGRWMNAKLQPIKWVLDPSQVRLHE